MEESEVADQVRERSHMFQVFLPCLCYGAEKCVMVVEVAGKQVFVCFRVSKLVSIWNGETGQLLRQ